MSTAMRFSDELVREAEAEALLTKRSAPKQIEYWAAIGKAVAHSVTNSDILALIQGLAEVHVTPRSVAPLDPDAVFAAMERAQDSGELRRTISRAPVRYEASETQPGLLDRIDAEGRRDTGHFRNGRFISVT